PCTSSLSPFDRRLPTFVLGSFGGSLYWTRQVSLRLRSPIDVHTSAELQRTNSPIKPWPVTISAVANHFGACAAKLNATAASGNNLRSRLPRTRGLALRHNHRGPSYVPSLELEWELRRNVWHDRTLPSLS
ncbi:MAG: hypothetical protein ACTS6G_01135, partial [Candidatus Hodgkinia cicadicola]